MQFMTWPNFQMAMIIYYTLMIYLHGTTHVHEYLIKKDILTYMQHKTHIPPLKNNGIYRICQLVKTLEVK